MTLRAQRPVVVANRIRQKRQVHPDAVFLIVEGDDDKKLFQKFVDGRRCRIQPAHGRSNVEEALAILEADGVWGVLAIVDTDFDVLEERVPASPNLLRTDTHDAETMMLASPALEHVLSEHGEAKQIAKFEASWAMSVRQHLLTIAETFGYLRWHANREQLSWRFDAFPFERVLPKKTWQLLAPQVLGELQGHSGVGVLDSEIINQALDALRARVPDVWQLCNGHDMVAILAIGLQRILGKRNAAEVKPEVLEKDLRLAYEAAYFAETTLCRALRDWHQAHTPILISALAPP